MKPLALLVLAPLLLAGCMAFAPERSQAYLVSLTQGAPQARYERSAGGRSVILAAYGSTLLPPKIQVELVKVMKHRQATGRWPGITELTAGAERWRVSPMEDMILLTRETGDRGPFSEFFFAPDGFVGLDADYRILFDQMDAIHRVAARMPAAKMSPK